MYDHLLMFANEQEARSACPTYWDTATSSWDSRYVISEQRVVIQRGMWGYVDGVLVNTVPETTIPGYFITITLDEISDTLKNLPNNACRTIGDRVTGQVVYVAPDLDPIVLSSAMVEPSPFGAIYSYME